MKLPLSMRPLSMRGHARRRASLVLAWALMGSSPWAWGGAVESFYGPEAAAQLKKLGTYGDIEAGLLDTPDENHPWSRPNLNPCDLLPPKTMQAITGSKTPLEALRLPPGTTNACYFTNTAALEESAHAAISLLVGHRRLTSESMRRYMVIDPAQSTATAIDVADEAYLLQPAGQAALEGKPMSLVIARLGTRFFSVSVGPPIGAERMKELLALPDISQTPMWDAAQLERRRRDMIELARLVAAKLKGIN